MWRSRRTLVLFSETLFFIIKTKRIKRNRETIWNFGILCYTVFDGFFEKVEQWITGLILQNATYNLDAKLQRFSKNQRNTVFLSDG